MRMDPSSSSGRNSVPRRGTSSMLAPKTASAGAGRGGANAPRGTANRRVEPSLVMMIEPVFEPNRVGRLARPVAKEPGGQGRHGEEGEQETAQHGDRDGG